MNLTTTNDNKTMSSIDLLSLINSSRESLGERQVRHNDFIARAMDELEGEHYETFVVQNMNKTETKALLLNQDQCMLVAMRESKMVRRSVLEKLKKINEPKLPQTFAEALQLAADQAKQLELAAPKVAFVDNLVERTNLLTATQVAQKHGKSAIWLNKILSEMKVYNRAVKRGKVFQQWFVDKGYGEMKKNEMGYDQPLFTNAGEVWINEQLFGEGLI